MSEQLEVLIQVANTLTDIGIDYMVSGSIAITFYAVPRMTRDIDFVIALQNTDIDRLVGAFSSDFYIDGDSVRSATASSSIFNMLHNDTLTKVDCIIRKNTKYRALEFQRRRTFKLGKTEISVVSAEDLILSKLVWAKDSQSELQLSDVRLLVSSDQKQLDWEYLQNWAIELDVDDQLEAARS